MRLNDKRGLSGIVVTLIMILLVFAAVIIIWVAISALLGSGTDEIGGTFGKLTTDMKFRIS